jgi:hypothetical protein
VGVISSKNLSENTALGTRSLLTAETASSLEIRREYERLLEKIRVLSAEYQALLDLRNKC